MSFVRLQTAHIKICVPLHIYLLNAQTYTHTYTYSFIPLQFFPPTLEDITTQKERLFSCFFFWSGSVLVAATVQAYKYIYIFSNINIKFILHPIRLSHTLTHILIYSK